MKRTIKIEPIYVLSMVRNDPRFTSACGQSDWTFNGTTINTGVMSDIDSLNNTWEPNG